MKKILAYPLTLIFYLFFGIFLVVFHVLQWITHNTFGYQAQKFSVELLNFFLLRCLNLLGTNIKVEIPDSLTNERPIIFVCNHQSTYEVPPIIWYLRKYHPKFISKKELGKGIPSVSFNLRHGGSVLIERNNPKDALNKIKKFGELLKKEKYSAVIFPEGTRSRDGNPKKFQKSGLLCLFESIPNARVVPVSIANSWKFGEHKYFPLPLGVKLHLTVHDPLEINHNEPEKFIERVENFIAEDVKRKQEKKSNL